MMRGLWLKICFIADGKSDHTQVIVNYFAKNDHEVHLIVYNFSDDYDKRVQIHRLQSSINLPGVVSPYLSFPIWIFQIKKLIRQIKPDIINIHYLTTYGLLSSAIDFHPLVVTAWGSDILIQPKNNLFWRAIVKSLLKKTDLFTCLFDLNILKDLDPLIPQGLKKASLPHGIDINLFCNSKNISNLRRSYGIEDTDPVIINIRGLEPIFDPVTFLRAIPIVLSEFPHARFIVTYQEERKAPYEKLINSLQIKENVIILGWMKSEEVAKHLGIADIYVSTSLSDGASNALFEGMSSELAPVVTDISANRVYIKNNENGFLFKPGDFNTLAEKIIYLIKDEAKRESFGKKCRKIVLEKADYAVQMKKTEKSYQDVIAEYLT